MGKPKRWLGLDIGGANLKVATSDGYARQVEFALWKHPDQLTETVAELLCEAPPHRGVIATMTGELCDCFETKAEGVAAITHAVENSAGGVEVKFYTMGEAAGITFDGDRAR